MKIVYEIKVVTTMSLATRFFPLGMIRIIHLFMSNVGELHVGECKYSRVALVSTCIGMHLSQSAAGVNIRTTFRVLRVLC